MSDQAFAVALRPAPVVILRVPMLGYSLGHELLLLCDGNAILLPMEQFNELEPRNQISSIMRASLVCSRTWGQNKKADRWVKVWGWLIRKDDFPLAIADFRNYRAAGSTFPHTLPADDNEKGRTLGAPFMARLTAYSVQCFGEAAYDQPLGALQWMYFSHMESGGACRVENKDEREAREAMDKLTAEILAEQEAKKKEGQCPP